MDDEVTSMRQGLVLSSLSYLRRRLENLVAKTLLTQEEAEIIYKQSPFQKQSQNRAGRLWTTNVPLPPNDHGVVPLLESWGGESAYFWLSNKTIAAKLKYIGSPRIVEIETALCDDLNACRVSETVLKAWAKSLGFSVRLSSCDLSITGCSETAKIIRVHTEGNELFNAIATKYPEKSCTLLGE